MSRRAQPVDFSTPLSGKALKSFFGTTLITLPRMPQSMTSEGARGLAALLYKLAAEADKLERMAEYESKPATARELAERAAERMGAAIVGWQSMGTVNIIEPGDCEHALPQSSYCWDCAHQLKATA